MLSLASRRLWTLQQIQFPELLAFLESPDPPHLRARSPGAWASFFSGVDVPQHWSSKSFRNGLILRLLGEGEHEYYRIAKLIQQTTCPSYYCRRLRNRVEILQVRRVENAFLWKSYCLKKQSMKDHSGDCSDRHTDARTGS